MKSTVSALNGQMPRPQAQALQAYRPAISSSSSTASDHVFLLSEEDTKLFISVCENPPTATAEMHDLAREVAEWFK